MREGYKREEYKREGLNGRNQFDEYEFLKDGGSYYATFVGRWKNKDDNLVCCFDFDDGRKVRSMVWKDSGYKDLNQIPLGSVLRLEFIESKTGKTYLKKVVPVDERVMRKETKGYAR